MYSTKRKLLFWSILLVSFAVLLVIATLFDHQISVALALPYLKDGNYMSTNVFGLIFEVIGEMPLYLMLSIAGAILFSNCDDIKNKKLSITLKIILFAACVFGCYYGWNRIGKYMSQIFPDTLSFLQTAWHMQVVKVILAIIVQVLMTLLFVKHKDLSKKLLKFAIVILITALISEVIVHIIKPIIARERFRATYVLQYNNLDHIGFTPWYVSNMALKKELLELPTHLSTYYSSFPSGHTASAAMFFPIMFLPLYIEKFNNKKGIALCIIFPTVATLIVALSRIVVGAHYMSDVLVGGTMTLVSSIFALKITNLIFKKAQKNG